jgi:RNA polymerase sigma-70 factor (ECF subfamily)
MHAHQIAEPFSSTTAMAREVDARLLGLMWAAQKMKAPVRTEDSGNFSPAGRQRTSDVEDVGLLEGARRGDATAFSTLFARYQGPILRYAAHMCGRDAADDVVQETFLAVLRGTGQYDASRGAVGSYLFGIARHFVLKKLTSRELASFERECDDHQCSTMLSEPPTILDSMTRIETIEAVRSAIRSLPPVYREAVVLCELQEMSYEAAAGIADCPIGTIRSRLHRAKALLTAKLSAAMPEAGSRR